MTSRLAALSLDAHDPHKIADFWAQVLGWQEIERDETGVSIGPADGSGPSMDVLQGPDDKVIKNRLHLDIRAVDIRADDVRVDDLRADGSRDGTTTEQELERLLALGATRTDVGQGPDVSWVVLADPEGNEFCLLSRTVSQAASG